MNKAICVKCANNIETQLENEFDVFCTDGPPKSVWFPCNNCGTTLYFKVDTCYTLCGFTQEVLPTKLPDDVIGYIPHTDGYDFNIIINLVFDFNHLFRCNDRINNNNDLDTYFKFNVFYKDLDLISDPEYSCGYWYFKYEAHAKLFVSRVNAWLKGLN